MEITAFELISLASPFVIGAIALSLAALIWNRRHAPGAIALIILLILVSGRLIAMGMGIWSDTLDHKIEWRRIELSAQIFLPSLLLFTSLQLSSQGHLLTRYKTLLVLVVPAITLSIIWLFGLNGTVVSQITMITSPNGITALEFTKEPLAQIILIYSILLGVVSAVLIDRGFRNSYHRPGLFRLILVGVVLAPVITNAIDVLWLRPSGSPISPVPFSLFITSVAIVLAFCRYGLFEIMPIARAAMTNQISDSVVVLETSGEIAEINASAIELFGLHQKNCIGVPFSAIADRRITDCVAHLREGQSAQISVGVKYLEIKNVFLRDDNQATVGKIVIAKDLSKQHRAEVGENRVFVTLSHEIKSALTLLTGFSAEVDNILPENMTSDNVGRLLRLSAIGVDRLVEMSIALSDWIELPDYQQGKSALNRDRVQICSLFDSAVNKTKNRASKRLLTMVVDLEEPDTDLVIDARRVQVALEVILLRSINRSKKSEDIIVSGHRKNRIYEIVISDSGPQVNEDDLRLMFDPFAAREPGEAEESEAIEVERYRLATAKGFIELLGGEMFYRSSSDSKSGFAVRLPVATGSKFETYSL